MAGRPQLCKGILALVTVLESILSFIKFAISKNFEFPILCFLFLDSKIVEGAEVENQPSHLMLTSAAGLNVIRHLHENSLCELALQYLLQVTRLLIHNRNFCFKSLFFFFK